MSPFPVVLVGVPGAVRRGGYRRQLGDRRRDRVFGIPDRLGKEALGRQTARQALLNVVLPFLSQQLVDLLLQLLQRLLRRRSRWLEATTPTEAVVVFVIVVISGATSVFVFLRRRRFFELRIGFFSWRMFDFEWR